MSFNPKFKTNPLNKWFQLKSYIEIIYYKDNFYFQL